MQKRKKSRLKMSMYYGIGVLLAVGIIICAKKCRWLCDVAEAAASTPTAAVTSPAANVAETTPAPASTPKPNLLQEAKDELETLQDEGEFLIQAKKVSDKKVKLSWKKGTKKYTYRIYRKIKKDGKFETAKLLATTNKNSYIVKKLNKNKQYKFYVQVCFRYNNKLKKLANSLPLRISTGANPSLNIKTVTVKQGNNLVLYAGQLHTIRYKIVLSGKKTVKRRPTLSYYSTNVSVARVDTKGIVTALKKGKTVIFAVAPSGAYDKIYIEVKK